MLFIHQTTCISPQPSFPVPDLRRLMDSADNKLRAMEPDYKDIPAGSLRRMGKAVRMGVGSALPLLKIALEPAGIIVGTANGGMEDCIKFLNQVIKYDEGLLTPGNFVQSTPNAVASQISLLNGNKAYNITHVHRGLAFENAVIDAFMLIGEDPSSTYLLGGVDEISTYNFNIEYLGGWYKKEGVPNKDLYQTNSEGSIAGEGAAMFLVNGIPASAVASLDAIQMLHGGEEGVISAGLQEFLAERLLRGEKIDLFISGENGDSRLLKFYAACEAMVDQATGLARFKHMSGEYPTASAMALWLACHIIQTQSLPDHMLKRPAANKGFNKILIYNNYKGLQHSFMLVSRA